MHRARDLEGERFDGPAFVIPDLVPEGVTLLSGTPKIGKSWLLLNFGVAVSVGGSTLGKPCSAYPVLYLALEDNLRRIQQRLHMMMCEEPFPEQLYIETAWDRFPAGLRSLEKLLAEYPIKLVLIDTLEMVRPPRRTNPYEDDYRALAGLRDLAGAHRIAFVVVTHNRKTATNLATGEELDPIERVSGTMGLTGCVDNILVLSRLRGTVMGELYVMGRDIEEQRLAVRLDPNIGLWSVHEQVPRH
jgi:hypothetical protein